MNKRIPQIKSVVGSLLVILIGSPMLGAYFAWQVGTLSTWHQVVPILKGSSLPAVMGCIGWLFLRSPFAGKFTELLNVKSDPVTGQKEFTKLTIDSPTAETPIETKEQEK